jgi:hypothetical protein
MSDEFCSHRRYEGQKCDTFLLQTFNEIASSVCPKAATLTE